MGEFVGSSLFGSKSEACGKCGMEKHTDESKDCCKDVLIVLKTSDSHTFSQIAYDFNFPSLIIPIISFTNPGISFGKEEIDKTFHVHSPPLLTNPLFIQYQNFRI
jgi:hypothetical protein